MKDDTKTLSWQLRYLEGQAQGLTVVSCRLFHRRHIFEGDDGRMYVLRVHAGWDSFNSTELAVASINHSPAKYLVS